MIKINKALVLLGMLLLAAVASAAAQEAETVRAETQPRMAMPNLNARRLNNYYYGGGVQTVFRTPIGYIYSNQGIDNPYYTWRIPGYRNNVRLPYLGNGAYYLGF